MSDLLTKYGTSNQALTCQLAPSGTGLANNGLRQSDAVDNTTNKFLDALVMVIVKAGASSVSSTGTINVYAYGTVDGGTTYSDGASGSDSSFTPTSPTNLRLIGVINLVANAATGRGGPWSVAAAFGGILPDHWGIVIENKSGAALDTTEASHKKLYQGIYGSVS